MIQFDAEFHVLQNGTTTTLYDALAPLPWPFFVLHVWHGTNYCWSQLFNIALSSTGIQILVFVSALLLRLVVPAPVALLVPELAIVARVVLASSSGSSSGRSGGGG